jgi:hypothetical protein
MLADRLPDYPADFAFGNMTQTAVIQQRCSLSVNSQ